METIKQPKAVCFGEILWDILPTGARPGGAPMNVAYHLAKLGVLPALISTIGEDDQGKELARLLEASGVNTDYLATDFTHATGLVHALPNEHNEVTYDIVFPSAWDFIEWKDEMEKVITGAQYFVYGSLTSRNKTSRSTLYQALEFAPTKVLDINLRPPHYNRRHVEQLLHRANILKMNLAELELVTGWFSRFSSIGDRMKLMQDQFSIDTIIVTMGGDGAMVNHHGTVETHPGFAVEVADTIGSGDAFLAGFLSQLLQGASIGSALAFASATGAFIATQSGACPPYNKDRINQLLAVDHKQSSTIHS